jgi:hypothetical protein
LEVGSYVVTFGDESKFMWRRSYYSEEVRKPMEDDDLFPEGWRVPKTVKKAAQMQFKSVCRIVSINFSDKVNCLARRQSVKAADVSMEAVLYVRPCDLGVVRNCAYELIETNQGW